MKKMLVGFSIIYFTCMGNLNYAVADSWDKCKGCHDGALAPDGNALKQKYKTVDELVNAAQKTDELLMERFKKDEELLRKAAEDIGLR